MIADLLDTIGGALSDAFGGFFMSAKADRNRYQRRHPDRAVYAPPIVRHHTPWPHESWPGGGQRPYERWPGDRR
jgi:hypothetical protein